MVHRTVYAFNVNYSDFSFLRRHSMQFFSSTCAQSERKNLNGAPVMLFVFNLCICIFHSVRYCPVSFFYHSFLFSFSFAVPNKFFSSIDCFYFNPFIIFIRLALRPTYSLFVLFHTQTHNTKNHFFSQYKIRIVYILPISHVNRCKLICGCPVHPKVL